MGSLAEYGIVQLGQGGKKVTALIYVEVPLVTALQECMIRVLL